MIKQTLNLNSKVSLLDFYFDEVYNHINFKAVYRGVHLGDLITKFEMSQDIESKSFIEKITRTNVELLVEKKKAAIVKRSINPLKTMKTIITDISRVAYYSRVKYDCSKQVYFFISNPKFLKFIAPLSRHYQERNISVGYVFWNAADIPSNFDESALILKPVFPNIFQKLYWTHYQYTAAFDRFFGLAKRIGHATLIVPEGCLISMHIAARICKAYNIKTKCIQWGFFGRSAAKVGWRHMPYDKYFVWGDFFKETFQKYNPDLQIVTSGHPKLVEVEQDKSKNTVLIAVQREMGDHISSADLRMFLECCYELIEALPKQQFILRTHPDLPAANLPKKPSASLTNLTIHEYSDFSLSQSFENASLCIGISSTTIVESVAAYCYPIFVKSNSLPLQIHEIMSTHFYTQHVFEFSELKQFIHDFDYQKYENTIHGMRKLFFSDKSFVNEFINVEA